MKGVFSFRRFFALLVKEFILMKRDPGVLVIMAVLPLILVCLAGFAVNLNPKHVPSVVVNDDRQDLTHRYVSMIQTTDYFNFKSPRPTEAQLKEDFIQSKILLVFRIPPDFSRDVLRGLQPTLVVEDGSTDVFSTSKALSALPGMKSELLEGLALGPTAIDGHRPFDFNILVQRPFDPERNTHYHLIPGMIGLVLMLTMLMITAVIAFRDIDGGTLESLLVTPANPLEILASQIVAYILVGLVQLSLGIWVAIYLFHIPFNGSFLLLYMALIPYLVAELSLGLTVSTFCRTQFQAVQIINLLIAFSIILTGFVFPVFGMPLWAQWLSYFIPLTHFLEILRGIMLKGANVSQIAQNLLPLMVFSFVMILLAKSRAQRYFR